MDEIDILIDEIKSTLTEELPSQYSDYVTKLETLTKQDLLRASYDVLDQLRRKKNWDPSAKLLGLIDRFKVVF